MLLAVGGWNHGSLLFSNMAMDVQRRRNFVRTTVDFLRRNNFDGLDLDWEFPASRDTEDRPDDKFHFTDLCKVVYCTILEKYFFCDFHFRIYEIYEFEFFN